MVPSAKAAAAEAAATPGRGVGARRARVGWAMFDWAQQPYFMMVVGFLFGPWFAAEYFDTPARGQAVYGTAIALTGLGIAALSPVLGAAVDAGRNPKTWLAALAVPFAVACFGLWFAAPGDAGLAPWIVAAIVVSGVATELSINTANSMLPYVAAPGRVGSLSGWATGLGYFGGLAAVLVALALAPLLGLSEATGETARIAGPLAGAWYLAFVAPLFLFVPRPPPGRPDAAGRPLKVLWTTLKALPRNRTMLFFLMGRMLLSDGANAAGAFGPVLARGLFGWTTLEVAVFGLLLALLAGLSCWLSGRLDDRWGSKRSLLLFTAVLAVAVCGFGLIEADRLFFSVPVTPPTPGDGWFASAGERLFIAFGVLIGVSFGPTGSVLRTWMARLAPPGEEGRWFGLFGLSGRATAFVAPAMIAALSAAVGDQRVVVPVVLAFLAAGAGFLAFTPAERARPAETPR